MDWANPVLNLLYETTFNFLARKLAPKTCQRRRRELTNLYSRPMKNGFLLSNEVT